MNSPYGSLDNNGGSLAYYCLTPWGEQTAFSGDSGAKDWSQEWIGQEFDYNNISEDAGGGWLVSDESHFGGGQMGDCESRRSKVEAQQTHTHSQATTTWSMMVASKLGTFPTPSPPSTARLAITRLIQLSEGHLICSSWDRYHHFMISYPSRLRMPCRVRVEWVTALK